jgi:hypothetical protein
VHTSTIRQETVWLLFILKTTSKVHTVIRFTVFNRLKEKVRKNENGAKISVPSSLSLLSSSHHLYPFQY